MIPNDNSTDSSSANRRPGDSGLKKHLTLLDSTAIIVGIIIGSGFYGMFFLVAMNAGGAWQTAAAWAAGGALALLGAACYAELGSAYPKAGGEYVYLSRAFGEYFGFLFAWGGFWIIRPVSIGLLAVFFADYAHRLLPLTEKHDLAIYSLASVTALTVINALGVQAGKWTQNLLTAIKVIGLLLVFAAGFMGDPKPQAAVAASSGSSDFALAMVFAMWVYGGWNEMASVAAEVRNPERNIFRALMLGTLAVTGIYLLGTAAFFNALGYQGTVSAGDTIAASVMKLRFEGWGPGFISALVCVSCLGAINGMIFTGSRIYYALGTRHRLYKWLGHWDARTGSPLRSI
jgi:basic amino acid/polyamine antiporter, APA family